jgi:hypothetical protein
MISVSSPVTFSSITRGMTSRRNREIFERRALEYSQKLADEWRDFVKVVDSDSVPTLFLDGSEEHMPLWAEPRG